MATRSALLLWLSGLLGGCIGDLEIEGKGCPCLDTHVCDVVLDLCVALGSAGAGHPDAAVKPQYLRAEWTTAAAIRWIWDLGGADRPDELAGYRLVVGPSEQAVLAEEGTEAWAGSIESATDPAHINPELGRYTLPRTGSLDPLVATISDLHDADAIAFARLVATDTAGRQWATNVAQARTTVSPRDEVVLFSEASVMGLFIPVSYGRTTGAAYQGTYHYEWVNSTGLGFEQLRHQPQPFISVDGVSEGSFASTAFVEMAVRLQADAPSFWSEIWIRFPDGTPEGFNAAFNPLSIRNDDAYRIIQVPLRVLRDKSDTVLLEHARLAQGVDEHSVGGQWSDGAIVRVDEVRVRW
jgi:hypothetical protein